MRIPLSMVTLKERIDINPRNNVMQILLASAKIMHDVLKTAHDVELSVRSLMISLLSAMRDLRMNPYLEIQISLISSDNK